jgi:hypothetical protein
MKRAGLFLALAIVLTISGTALAQGDNSVYFVTYYANNVSGAPDATLRVINDGEAGSIRAVDIYIFDDSQELVACGSCQISPDGLLSEDVKTELTNNPLTGRVPSRGVIKVISEKYVNSTPPTQFSPSPLADMRGWATHIERATPTSGAYATTEAPLADSNLSTGEQSLLGNLCYYASLLGSGQGTITCTPEDNDF